MTKLFLGLVSIFLLLVPNVYAGGPRGDWFGEYADVPGAVDCWYNGYDSGFAGKYDKDRAKECIFNEIEFKEEDRHKPYYKAFIIGRKDGGNTEEECGELINNPVELEKEEYGKLGEENESLCYNKGKEDGKDSKPYNKEIEDGCYEFGGYDWGYTEGYK